MCAIRTDLRVSVAWPILVRNELLQQFEIISKTFFYRYKTRTNSEQNNNALLIHPLKKGSLKVSFLHFLGIYLDMTPWNSTMHNAYKESRFELNIAAFECKIKRKRPWSEFCLCVSWWSIWKINLEKYSVWFSQIN